MDGNALVGLGLTRTRTAKDKPADFFYLLTVQSKGPNCNLQCSPSIHLYLPLITFRLYVYNILTFYNIVYNIVRSKFKKWAMFCSRSITENQEQQGESNHRAIRTTIC